MEKRPKLPANHVKEKTVIAAMPTTNLRPCSWISEMAPLQVAQRNSRGC